MPSRPRVSIVVPVYNEQESIPRLVDAVRVALEGRGQWELLLIDDGSTDRTREIASALAAADPRVRVIPLARNYGQTAATQAGFDHAVGEVVVSMDGDLQNDPADIPRIAAMLEQDYDLVAGYREQRRDPFLTRRLPSLIANRIIRHITGVQIRDNGCSLKGYRRELLQRLHLYSDMHRFIPAVAAATAGARIAEIPVRHHPRRFGRSKYGLSRIAKVLADLLTIKMIRSFRDRPLVMFASAAIAALALSVTFTVAAGISLARFTPAKADALVLPGAALLWFGLAAYLLMLGLIAEVALRESRTTIANDLPMVREDPA
jgi:glycosyltransferase involved in cell wall biosynthesis